MFFRYALIVPCLCLYALPGVASSWAFDADHSSISFAVKHAMISNVHGTFRVATGTLDMDDKDVSKSQLNMEIRIDSIDTRNEKRDGHLKSADFFDAGKYPTMTFKSTKVEKQHANLKVTGDLTMHGVTKSVVLQVEGPAKPIKDPFGMVRSGVSATGKLKRKDFGLKWSQVLETGGLMVADDIILQIDAEFIKKVEPAAVAPPAGTKAPQDSH